MPLNGLDPSMLIGFLCRTEEDWLDLRKRIAAVRDLYLLFDTTTDPAVQLPKTTITIMDEPPSWPEGSEYDMGMESVSEQDVLELSDDEGELGISKPEGEDEDEEDDEDDDDDDDGEQFFDTRSASASLSSGGRNQSSAEGDGRRDDNDTEEEPIDPVTPGPASKFDMGASYTEKEDGDIEDDWVEPSMPTPMPHDERFTMVDKPKPSPPQHQHSGSTSSSASALASTSSQPSTASSADIRVTPAPPPIMKSKSRDGVTKKRKAKKQVPVPVPMAKETEAYPFPVTRPIEGDEVDDWDKDDEEPSVSFDGVEEKPRRMHTARARDGGRTQSGGVKGILSDDLA